MGGRKRGITNIEMIIATTIFVFAVILVVYYISFIGLRDKPPEVFLNTLEQKFRGECEVEYNVTPLYPQGAGCIKIDKHFTIIEEKNTTILKESGNALDFKISGDDLLVKNPGNAVALIYAFPYNVTKNIQLTGDCQQTGDYGITSQGRIFVLEKLVNLKSQPYGSWKGVWKLQRDFIINVSKIDGTEIVVLNHTKALEVPVLAKQFPIKIIDEDGNIFDASVNLQVW